MLYFFVLTFWGSLTYFLVILFLFSEPTDSQILKKAYLLGVYARKKKEHCMRQKDREELLKFSKRYAWSDLPTTQCVDAFYKGLNSDTNENTKS